MRSCLIYQCMYTCDFYMFFFFLSYWFYYFHSVFGKFLSLLFSNKKKYKKVLLLSLDIGEIMWRECFSIVSLFRFLLLLVTLYLKLLFGNRDRKIIKSWSWSVIGCFWKSIFSCFILFVSFFLFCVCAVSLAVDVKGSLLNGKCGICLIKRYLSDKNFDYFDFISLFFKWIFCGIRFTDVFFWLLEILIQPWDMGIGVFTADILGGHTGISRCFKCNLVCE